MGESDLRIAVVGAGPAGLSAAVRLAGTGARVVVYEAAAQVGGRTRTDRVDGYAVDTGAQLFGSMDTRLLALARQVGLEARITRSPGRDALWRRGRAHEVVYGSPASMLASSALSLGTKFRLGSVYLPFLSRNRDVLDVHALERAHAAGLDRETIAAWGQRELGRDFVDALVFPQLAAYYGAAPEHTSAALYHMLASYGTGVEVYALAGGAGVLCEALAARVERRGGEVRLGVEVREVAPEGAGVVVAAGEGEQRYDAAVVATPAPVAQQLLGAGYPAAAQWLTGVRTRPALTLALLLDRPVGVRYFGLSFPRGAAEAVAAVCVEENKGPGLVPEGRGLLVALASPPAAEALLDRDPRAVLDALLPDVRLALPHVERSIARARVYRWPHGPPTFYPGYLARVAEFRTGRVEGDGRLALAGDYLHAPSAEGAVTAGLEAAERILERLRPGV